MRYRHTIPCLAVILTASTFGAINSKVWFNVAIAVLFVFLALAMFDVIAIDFSKYQSKLDLAGKGGGAGRGTFALAFGMGAVAALLAGACVAPVVIQVIVYASAQYAKGVTIALALPFFLGVGMALPCPFAGAGLSVLPKPRRWTTRVKQAMGLFILVFAAYYGYTAWKIFDSTRVDRAAVASAVQEHLEGGWTASICEGLQTARAQDKLVLIDMWATWCKNCLAMDKTTFKDDAVVARLDDYVKIKFQAEDLTALPNREMLEMFEAIDSPSFGMTFDTGNAFRYGDDPVEAARKLGKYIHAIHFKDVAPLDGGNPDDWFYNACTPIGQGVIDLPSEVATLRRIGYRGHISLELFNAELWAKDPNDVLSLAVERMRTLLAG